MVVCVYKRFIRELVTYFHTGLPVGDKLRSCYSIVLGRGSSCPLRLVEPSSTSANLYKIE